MKLFDPDTENTFSQFFISQFSHLSRRSGWFLIWILARLVGIYLFWIGYCPYHASIFSNVFCTRRKVSMTGLNYPTTVIVTPETHTFFLYPSTKHIHLNASRFIRALNSLKSVVKSLVVSKFEITVKHLLNLLMYVYFFVSFPNDLSYIPIVGVLKDQ